MHILIKAQQKNDYKPEHRRNSKENTGFSSSCDFSNLNFLAGQCFPFKNLQFV